MPKVLLSLIPKIGCENLGFMFSNSGLKIVIALLLYALTVFLRLENITDFDLQADEAHWATRSRILLDMLHANPSRASSHLGHPGVPPTLIMAFGQWLGMKIQLIETGDLSQFDRLLWSRISVVAVSSLVLPIIFLVISTFVSVPVAAVASTFLLFDPVFSAYGRIAHLDAIHVLLVTLTILFFELSLRRSSLKFKLLSALFFGLSITTKPTAVVLLFCFFIYRLLRSSMKGEKIVFFEWSDISCLFISQAVLGILYTRLWQHPSHYFLKLGIRSEFALFLWDLGNYLREFYFVSFSLLGLLILLAFLSKGTFRKSLIAIIAFFVSLAASPAVYDNLIRFWLWVFGLSSTGHKAYGRVIESPLYGYSGLFASRLSEAVLLSVLCGLVFIVKDWRLKKKEDSYSFVLFLLISSVLWVLPLSISPKQSWRYILPILPSVYIVAAYGLTRFAESLAQFKLATAPRVSAASATVFCFMLFQVSVFFASGPYYQLYYNSLSGGLQGASIRNSYLGGGGEHEAIGFLISEALKRQQSLKVAVTGDAHSLYYSTKRWYPEQRHLIHFGYFNTGDADYLLLYPNLAERMLNNEWSSVIQSKSVFEKRHKEVSLFQIKEVKPFVQISSSTKTASAALEGKS